MTRESINDVVVSMIDYTAHKENNCSYFINIPEIEGKQDHIFIERSSLGRKQQLVWQVICYFPYLNTQN